MRTRMVWLVALLATAGGIIALSLSRGQEQVPAAPPPLVPPKPAQPPTSLVPHARVDLNKLSPFHRQMYLSAQGGATWLYRANGTDGRFLHGFVPALRVPLEGDHYLRQAGAAFALAQAARFTRDERFTAKARQAVVTLLLDTAVAPADPQARRTTLPSLVVNRLGAAGLLVMAINELPRPAADLLAQSEQLCRFIRLQQQPDGSLRYWDEAADGKAAADPDGVNFYPGEALYGLMVSQRHKPAPWKTEVVRRALKYYQAWWRAHKLMAMVPWQTAACAEAFRLTKEKVFADFALEMNDWLLALQYTQLERRHPLWVGGFMSWGDGKPAPLAPDAGAGYYALSLAQACRVAHQAGDLQRYQRYREALENSLRFLITLQYTEAGTQHFADWYRPVLLGAFHATHQDGNVRIDYTQYALGALIEYLQEIVASG